MKLLHPKCVSFQMLSALPLYYFSRDNIGGGRDVIQHGDRQQNICLVSKWLTPTPDLPVELAQKD